ncbi:hypothetical protein ACWDWO_06475 [Actinopolymorpha singaporensis]
MDTVICTHVHGDHVGWNTCLTAEGEWRPTFPTAQYVISRAHFDYWNPANGHRTRSGLRMANVFEDSVAPCTCPGRLCCGRATTTPLTPKRLLHLRRGRARARDSRRRVLGEAADRGALLFPAHFPGQGAVEVRRLGDRFTVNEWAAWR